MSSVEPYDRGGEIDRAEEVMRPFIVPCGNGAVVLEFCKEVLDQMPGLIQVFIVVALLRAI